VTDKNPLRVIDDRANKVGDTPTFTPEVLFPGLLELGYTITVTGLPQGLTAGAGGVVGGQTTARGLYPVTVTLISGAQTHARQFFWNVTDAASARIEGPSVVLGNATYQYQVHWGEDITGLPSLFEVVTPSGEPAPGVTIGAGTETVVNGKTVSTIPVTYPAAPAKYILRATRNFQLVAQLPVTAVTVFIRDKPGAQAFTPGTVTQAGSGPYGGGNLNGVYVTTIQAFQASPRQLGLVWQGTYGVVGPNDGQGVTQVKLGFIQTVGIGAAAAYYADGNRLAHFYDRTPLASLEFLDAGVGSVWYGATFTPTQDMTSKDYMHSDSPNMQFAMSSDKMLVLGMENPVVPADRRLTQTEYTANFTLNFAAQSLDPLSGGNYYSYATAAWSFTADGTVDAAGVWTAAATAGISAPTSWTMLSQPTMIGVDDPVANQIGPLLNFH